MAPRTATKRAARDEPSAALSQFIRDHNAAYDPIAQLHRMERHARQVIDSAPECPRVFRLDQDKQPHLVPRPQAERIFRAHQAGDVAAFRRAVRQADGGAGIRLERLPAVNDAAIVLDLARRVRDAMQANDGFVIAGLMGQCMRSYMQMAARVLEAPTAYGLRHLLLWRGEWLEVTGKPRRLLEQFAERDRVPAAELRVTLDLTEAKDPDHALEEHLHRVRKLLPWGAWIAREGTDVLAHSGL